LCESSSDPSGDERTRISQRREIPKREHLWGTEVQEVFAKTSPDAICGRSRDKKLKIY